MIYILTKIVLKLRLISETNETAACIRTPEDIADGKINLSSIKTDPCFIALFCGLWT